MGIACAGAAFLAAGVRRHPSKTVWVVTQTRAMKQGSGDGPMIHDVEPSSTHSLGYPPGQLGAPGSPDTTVSVGMRSNLDTWM